MGQQFDFLIAFGFTMFESEARRRQQRQFFQNVFRSQNHRELDIIKSAVDICVFEAMPMRLLRLLRNLPHSQRKAQLRNQKLLSWEVVISSKFQSILSFLHHPCRNFPTQAVALLFVAVFSRSLVLKSSSQCIHTNH